LRTGSPGAARRDGQSRSRSARPGSSAPVANCSSGRMRAAIQDKPPGRHPDLRDSLTDASGSP
jgi:hypothetical protein